MSSEIAVSSEHLATLIALVGFVISVGKKMSFEIWSLIEASLAHLALVRRLLHVKDLMNGQCSRLTESLPTFCADERLLLGVNVSMISQVVLPPECFAANIAWVGSFICVSAFMDEKIVRFRKLSVAKFANELFLGAISSTNRRFHNSLRWHHGWWREGLKAGVVDVMETVLTGSWRQWHGSVSSAVVMKLSEVHSIRNRRRSVQRTFLTGHIHEWWVWRQRVVGEDRLEGGGICNLHLMRVVSAPRSLNWCRLCHRQDREVTRLFYSGSSGQSSARVAYHINYFFRIHLQREIPMSAPAVRLWLNNAGLMIESGQWHWNWMTVHLFVPQHSFTMSYCQFDPILIRVLNYSEAGHNQPTTKYTNNFIIHNQWIRYRKLIFLPHHHLVVFYRDIDQGIMLWVCNETLLWAEMFWKGS